MSTIIEIEGKVVRHVERNIISETTLAAAAPHLERRAPSIFPILPNNTVLAGFDPDNNRGAVIVERPPERININVHFDRGLTGNTPNADYNRGVRSTFHIQLPYLYFVYGFTMRPHQVNDAIGLADFTLDTSHVYWRPDPLRKMDDRLWPALLPNVTGGRICWGYTEHDNDTLAVRINHMVNEFPITTFNNHYGMPRPSRYESYVAWEEASENPLVYRDWEEFTRNQGSVKAGEHLRATMGTNYAELPFPTDEANVLITEPPRQFTYGRLREWFNSIPEPLRARFIAEAARIAETDPADD